MTILPSLDRLQIIVRLSIVSIIYKKIWLSRKIFLFFRLKCQWPCPQDRSGNIDEDGYIMTCAAGKNEEMENLVAIDDSLVQGIKQDPDSIADPPSHQPDYACTRQSGHERTDSEKSQPTHD